MTIESLAQQGDIAGCALYTPVGSETQLRALIPDTFEIVSQFEGDFGERLRYGARELLERHDGAILVNSDSPTLPASILRAAVDVLKAGEGIVLSPAEDGGYTLIGVSRDYPRLFENMPWSTAAVHRITVERAQEIGVPVVNVDGWYDVDDATSLAMLEREFAGIAPTFARRAGADAPATRQFLQRRVHAHAG